MKNLYILFFVMFLCGSLSAQKKINVLFIGDSYTSVNNLPLTVANMAKGHGDTLIYDSNTPGGTTLQGQCANTTTLAKIAQGGWDYVVLQAQSEEPSFPPSQVLTDTYPYAHTLDSLIHAADSCTETVFYMTWGHQNGDPPNCAGYPQICTYTGMQDRLTQSYLEMGQLNQATVAPVGEAWRKIVNQSRPFDMYISDSTHPSIYGTYLAASVFYEILFEKNVITDTFITVGIADSNALLLRQTAHAMVSDSLSKWYSSGHVPMASFTHNTSGLQVAFSSTSINGESFSWNYGDNTNGTGSTSSHNYTSSGRYPVTLTVYDHCKRSTYTDTVSVTISGIPDNSSSSIKVYPNPVSSVLHIEMADLDIKNTSITLVNGLGQIVRRIYPSSSAVEINLADLPGGLYTLSIKNNAINYNYPVLLSR